MTQVKLPMTAMKLSCCYWKYRASKHRVTDDPLQLESGSLLRLVKGNHVADANPQNPPGSPPGPAPRRVEFDLEAVMLAAISIFLWASLLSYDPADVGGSMPGPFSNLLKFETAVHPLNETPHNWCGWSGAWASQLMVQGLGVGSVFVTVGLSVLSIWMFRVQSNYVRASRQFGWLLVVLAITTLVSLLRLDTPLSSVIGAGGYLGAMTSTWLNEHFAIAGSFILTSTLLVAGVLLSTDYVVVRALAWMLLGGATVATTAANATRKRISIPVGRSVLPANSPAGVPRPKTSDVDLGVELPSSSVSTDTPTVEPPVRIRGQQLEGPTPTPVTPVATAAVEGVAATVKAIASNLAGNLLTSVPAPLVAGIPETPAESNLESEVDQESQTDESEVREIEVEGETVQVRADEGHAVPGPRVRSGKTKKSEKQAAAESLGHLDDTRLPEGAEEYVLPGVDLLTESDDIDFESQTVEVRRKAKILEKTFQDFGFNVRVVEIETGPVIAQYEVELEAGLRLSKITGLSEDLAIALRVPSVRIVAPIPGKNTVGIEVPNETRQVVRLREVIEEGAAASKKAKIPLFLGKDVSGNALTVDLASLPHLLIAGRTGTGKSVCLNAIIASILMTKRPDEVRMLMIDPKMVELSGYGRLPHLMHPVVTDMKKAEAILAWAVDKMEERYALLARAGVRHIVSYNQLGREELLDRLKPETEEEADAIPDHLPFIVIVADEMADLMMTAGKEVEQHIIRLAQKSRAIGIHLILATQKPTVDVITGLIKSNLPARISFQVASRTDSRVVLDEMGADKLLGNGDMLFLWPGTSTLLRGQGTYLSDDEINAVVDHCSTGEQNFVNELVNLKVKEEEGEEPKLNMLKKRDELYAAAVEIVIREGRGSVSLLQRALGIGYGRAARLVDFMAEDGIVGNYAGSQAREVVISLAEWEAMRDGGEVSSSAPPPPASRKNRILPRDEHWEEEQNAEPSETATPTRKSLKVKPVAAATAENDDDQDEDVEWEDVDDEAEYEDD
jgi:DNA segregation ATPase FtsK/SpoIIIE, S-DNA-T family